MPKYSKDEQYAQESTLAMQTNYAELIRLIGEDPTREGLLKTP